MVDIDAIPDTDTVSGSRRELVRAATIASQLPVLNFGNIYTTNTVIATATAYMDFCLTG